MTYSLVQPCTYSSDVVLVFLQGLPTDLLKLTTLAVETGISHLSDACLCRQERKVQQLLPTVMAMTDSAKQEMEHQVTRYRASGLPCRVVRSAISDKYH